MKKYTGDVINKHAVLGARDIMKYYESEEDKEIEEYSIINILRYHIENAINEDKCSEFARSMTTSIARSEDAIKALKKEWA